MTILNWICLWYVIGTISYITYNKLQYGEVTIKDFLLSCTLMGLCGCITAIVSIYYFIIHNVSDDFWDRKLF